MGCLLYTSRYGVPAVYKQILSPCALYSLSNYCVEQTHIEGLLHTALWSTFMEHLLCTGCAVSIGHTSCAQKTPGLLPTSGPLYLPPPLQEHTFPLLAWPRLHPGRRMAPQGCPHLPSSVTHRRACVIWSQVASGSTPVPWHTVRAGAGTPRGESGKHRLLFS